MATSLIPDGVIDDFKLSEKAVSLHKTVRTTDSGGAWASGSETLDSVNNDVTMTNESAGNVVLVSYTAKIPTTQVSDHKIPKIIGNYVTATNSHSIYKCNQLVPTDKVNVGNGDNGLESERWSKACDRKVAAQTGSG